jgi:hypothetical protein
MARPSSPRVVEARAASNAEFFARHARAGCVGLVGGDLAIDKAIRKAQRALSPEKAVARYSHAFVFVGPREDGHLWALESDLDFHRERVQLGVQENRVEKYADADYPNVAVLDFGLTAAQTTTVLGVGLDLLARRTQYSLRELLAVYWSLKQPSRRQGANALAQERAMFCSAFVQHLYLAIELDFAPDVATKLTLPEDIAQTRVPHTRTVRVMG